MGHNYAAALLLTLSLASACARRVPALDGMPQERLPSAKLEDWEGQEGSQVVIMGIDLENQLVLKSDLGSPWVAALPPSAQPGLLDATVLQDGTLLGVSTQFGLFNYDPSAGNWTDVPNSLSARREGAGSSGGIGCAPGSTQGCVSFTAGSDGGSPDYTMSHPLLPLQQLRSSALGARGWNGGVRSVAQLQDGTLVGVGLHDFELYSMQALGQEWVHVPGSGAVLAVEALPGGQGLLGVGLDTSLWVRPFLTGPFSGWSLANRSGIRAQSVAALPSGALLLLGADLQVYYLKSLDDVLQQLPNTGPVRAIGWVPASATQHLFSRA